MTPRTLPMPSTLRSAAEAEDAEPEEVTSLLSIGIKNAAVFPEPVRAMPTTSTPAKKEQTQQQCN